MAEKIKEMVVCNACGKNVPQTDIRHLRLKTCCSYRQVPVCKECWVKMNKKV